MSACVHCGANNQSDDQNCATCGKALSEGLLLSDDLINAGIVCPNCDAYNEPSRRTCISCGESLAGITEFLQAVSDPCSKDRSEQEHTSELGQTQDTSLPTQADVPQVATEQQPTTDATEEIVEAKSVPRASEQEDKDEPPALVAAVGDEPTPSPTGVEESLAKEPSVLAGETPTDELPMPNSIPVSDNQTTDASARQETQDAAPAASVEQKPAEVSPSVSESTLDPSEPRLIDASSPRPKDYVSTTATLLQAADRISDKASDGTIEETPADQSLPTEPPASLSGPPENQDKEQCCPHCQAAVTSDAQFCLDCGQPIATTPPVQLRMVRCYGSAKRVDQVIPIDPAGLTIGRDQAGLCIADDPYLSPVHLVIERQGDRLMAQDLGSYNGSFVRIRDKTEIMQNAEFIAGSQRFCFLGLGGPTSDVRIPNQKDTESFGGEIPRRLFVALRLLHSGANGQPASGSVFLRQGPELSIGQSDCDLNFPDDAAMAPVHLVLHIGASGVHLVPHSSSTEVFVNLTAKTELCDGDELQVGAEVFRVER